MVRWFTFIILKIFSYDYKYVSGNPQTKIETYNTQ